jgi:hypothetical protein
MKVKVLQISRSGRTIARGRLLTNPWPYTSDGAVYKCTPLATTSWKSAASADSAAVTHARTASITATRARPLGRARVLVAFGIGPHLLTAAGAASAHPTSEEPKAPDHLRRTEGNSLCQRKFCIVARVTSVVRLIRATRNNYI